MRWLCRSFWFLGICLASSARGAPDSDKGMSPPSGLVVEQWQTAEVADGVRLALARSGPSERVAFCVVFSSQTHGRDAKQDTKALGMLVDLEMRAESLALALRARAEANPHDWRRFEAVEGDRVTFCLGAPSGDQASAVSTLLDLLNPVPTSSADCFNAVARWHEHKGLAEPASNSAFNDRVHELAWLGSREPTMSFAKTLLDLPESDVCERWRAPSNNPQFIVTLTAAGSVDGGSIESMIRAHPAVRQRQRMPHLPRVGPEPSPKLPAQTQARFVRLRSTGHTESRLLIAWPFTRESQQQQSEVRLIAGLMQHRVNQRFGPSDARHAIARLHFEGPVATLQVEVRPIRFEELAATEETVFGVVDQLRSNAMGADEITSARALVTSTQQVTGDLAMDQAIYMADEALIYWHRGSTAKLPDSSPGPAELQHRAGQMLSRLRASELVCEAAAPPRTDARRHVEGQRPKIGASGGRYPRLAYTVKSGESLQVIAQRFRVTIPDLIRANHLQHPDQITPGTRLIIPIVSSMIHSN